MNPIDAAKDVVRIATTAGLAKDVIDLMEKKLALLTEEVASLTQRAAAAESKNVHLEADNIQLRAQFKNVKPACDLEPNAFKVLKHIFDRNATVPVGEIAQLLNCDVNAAQYYCDILTEKDFISFNLASLMSRMNSKPMGYTITRAGRKFVMETIDSV